jgi:ABC-type antimicrobial peptide transport system permease subunit
MKRILILTVFAVALGVGTTIAMLSPQGSKQTKVHEQHDKTTYPIADYEAQEPSDLNSQNVRKARAKRHNIQLRASDKVDINRLKLNEDSKSSWGGPPSHAATEPGLPASQSDVIVVGKVSTGQAFLSEDKTSIYSEFTVLVDGILKNNSSFTLTPGNSITTVRTGGALRFPSGKIIQRGFGGKPFPLINRTYVFFLKYENEEQDYPIITAYELRAGVVYPLDGFDIDGRLLEPYAEYQKFKGWDEASFLNKIREAIAESPDDRGGPR